jgi:hypothetical protein
MTKRKTWKPLTLFTFIEWAEGVGNFKTNKGAWESLGITETLKIALRSRTFRYHS